MSAPLSPERLAEIRDRAVYLRGHGADADEYEIELSAGTDVPALLAEVERLRAERDAEVQAAVDGMREAWASEVGHVQRQLADRPRRAEVLRQEATNLRCVERTVTPGAAQGVREGLLRAALVLDERADAAEQGETGGAR